MEEFENFIIEKPKHQEFSNRLKWLIENLLKDKKINFQEIISEVKDEKSILEKVRKKNIRINDMQDIIRLRVITYLKSDSEKVSELIKREFKVDEKLTKDYSKILETDRVGYRSKNFVVRLDETREKSSEWKNYSERKFEIQVHTILEHAWSEIQHDRNYKFFGELPENISRKFSLLAGSLELLDLNFDELCHQVDNYEQDVRDKLSLNKLEEVEINSLSLGTYLSETFKDLIAGKIEPKFFKGSLSIEAIKDMGISNLRQIDEAIKSLPVKKYLECQNKIDFSDLVRDFLLMKFGVSFLDAGEGKKWKAIYMNIAYNREELEFFKTSRLDLESVSKERKLNWKITEDILNTETGLKKTIRDSIKD